MPLSEHEERILAEIERQLAAEDPRFVARARRTPRNLSRTTRMRLAIALGILGALSLFGLVFNIAFGALVLDRGEVVLARQDLAVVVARGRLEGDPAVAGEQHLDPGVGVGGGDRVLGELAAGVGVGLLGHARRAGSRRRPGRGCRSRAASPPSPVAKYSQ
jgi:hypothetical protein